MTQIFISWSGSLGKQIAEYLYRDLFDYETLEPWISSHDITAGSSWFEETKSALSTSDFGVVCLTPGASKRPWINFEIGWLYGQLDNCKIITFGEELDNPLACLQRRDGKKKETWVELLREMLPKETHRDNEIRDRINYKFSDLEAIFNRINESPHQYHCEMDLNFSRIYDSVDDLKRNESIQANILLQQVISKSYSDIIKYSSKIESHYSIPASEYPKYLIHLQTTITPKPIVNAIALVDIEEDFWRFPIGNRIKDTSSTESKRIFAFTKKEDLQSYFPTLREHSRKYNVFAVSLQRLSDVIGDKAEDFSILTSAKSRLLSTYQDGTDIQNEISFISNPEYIQDYSDSFDYLIKSTFVVPIADHDFSEEDIRNISRKVFFGITLYTRKPVEMSLYINVFDYDDHEDKHAYYKEMTNTMIDICQSDSSTKNNIEVLELGAGTGIFTMMLANKIESKLSKIDAIEFDWHCYKLLNIKMREFATSNPGVSVNVHHEDSRTYDPNGKFDYIFSAFADHHIKKRDKEIYFENIKNNLKPGGLFIVGDEFLKEHSPDEREMALRSYHNHIIEIAKREGHLILAELEEKALESGLEEKGDFKVSCSTYEKFLRDAGFSIKEVIRIGPFDRDDIGGIYVYIAQLN